MQRAFYRKKKNFISTLWKKNQPKSSIVAKLPDELFPIIAKELSIHDTQNLLKTCGYFFNHRTLREVLIEKMNDAFMIVPGSFHTLIVHKESGKIYSVGNNDKGQSGFDDTNRKQQKKSPRQILISDKVKMVAAGYNHTLVLGENHLFGFGYNHSSQLGLGERYFDKNILQPQKISIPEIPKKIFTSNSSLSSSTIIQCENNHLYTFGANNKGQLGLGDLFTRHRPTLMPFSINNHVREIIVGAHHAFLITDKGIYGFGGNECGQLGLGRAIHFQTAPKLIPFKEYGIEPIQICAGDYHTLILDKSGKVFGLGANGCSQLGLPTGVFYFIPEQIPIPCTEKVTKLTAKAATSFIWCKDLIYAFGDNNHGQLCLDKTAVTVPIPTLLNLPLDLPSKDVLDIIPGGSHTFMICKTNRLFVFGNNYYAQLGSNEIGTDQFKPKEINLLKCLHKEIEEEQREIEERKEQYSLKRKLNFR